MYIALLTSVVTWISANFELPPDYNHPSIKLVPAIEITFLHYKAFTAAQQRELLGLQAEKYVGPLTREYGEAASRSPTMLVSADLQTKVSRWRGISRCSWQ